MFPLCSVIVVLAELIFNNTSHRKSCGMCKYGKVGAVPKRGIVMKQNDEICQFHQLFLFLLSPAGLNGTLLSSFATLV